MGLLREIPPTAGWPISMQDTCRLVSSCRSPYLFEQALSHTLGLESVVITNSGTTALYLIMKLFFHCSSKRTVIIPAFICPLVPLAMVRAGFKVEVCDTSPGTMQFDLTMLEQICKENSDIVAVLVVHLGGILLDIEAVEAIARLYDIYVIEDAAQALGGQYQNQYVGTRADIGFFSLCRGKGLTIYEGGIIVTKKPEWRTLLAHIMEEEVHQDWCEEILKIIELFGYALLYRPMLFWWVYRLPEYGWRLVHKPLRAMREEYSLQFPVHRVSRIRKYLGYLQWTHAQAQIQNQREKALYYIHGLKKLTGLQVLEELPSTRATYPYVTVLCETVALRDCIMRALGNTGFGVSQIYACAITEYPFLNNFLCARRVMTHAVSFAQQHFTLSTSIFLTKREMDIIIDTICRVYYNEAERRKRLC